MRLLWYLGSALFTFWLFLMTWMLILGAVMWVLKWTWPLLLLGIVWFCYRSARSEKSDVG